jgi:class 3 adenylate cyclase/tetratricopeptide (TPR) repeat protein
MEFDELLTHVIALLQHQGRVSYGALKRRFHLDDDYLDDLKVELIEAQGLAADEQGRILVWLGSPAAAPRSTAPAVRDTADAPLAYMPPYLTEKILASRAALEGERKQVTVFFADIKDSTRLIEGLDPEAAQQLLDPAIHLMMDAVHRFEGTVNQVMGDGIMALFGAPLAHEDHALRACDAALAMQASVTQYAGAVPRPTGVPMQMRVGLNSGEVVVRAIGSDLHMDYTAVGHTTHLAARMEQMAMPGSIVITPEVLRLAEGYVQVNALGPVPVKGLHAPLEVYEVLATGVVRSRLQAAAVRGLAPFVGRDRELTQLHQALEWAGSGHGQLVALVGEPGVGKSRLVEECLHAPRTQGWLVVESRALSYGQATPYLPVIDLLKDACGIDASDEPPRRREKVLGTVVGLDAALEPILPPLLALLDVPVDEADWPRLDPPQRRQRTLEALKRRLLRASQRQPLLVIGEDLHWIDAETQAFLDSLVESLHAARGLLLVNYRPEYQHGWGGKTSYTQVRLDPLPPERADELLQALLGDDPQLHPLKRLLIERTERNPFFTQGDLEPAMRVLEPGLALCRASGNRAWLPSVAAGLGSAAALRGRLAEGRALLEEAISEDIRMGVRQGLAYGVAWLSEVCRLAGRGEEAWQHARQALDLARQQKARGNEAHALHQLGVVQAHCHHGLGRLYGQTGRGEEAGAALTTAIDLYCTMEMTFWLPQAEAALAQVEGR